MAQSEPNKATAVNTTRPIDWPETVLKLGALIISKNLLLPFGIMAFGLLCAYQMNSSDLRAVLEKIIDHRWFAVGGWVCFVGTVLLSIRIVRWQASMYREQLTELKRGQMPPPQTELQLTASSQPKK
ncbi:MAG TPA: hypothetical protein VGO57_14305 [Verrucomicrobiae bacterium]|jgi:hypothetical protein